MKTFWKVCKIICRITCYLPVATIYPFGSLLHNVSFLQGLFMVLGYFFSAIIWIILFTVVETFAEELEKCYD